jgi:hypothetical protein
MAEVLVHLLQINKHRYSMAKDDIVIGLGRPMYGSSVHANRKKAYPSVITTLGQMEPEARRWIAVHNFLCRSYLDSDYMKKTYLTAICSDSEPSNEELKKAYKSAGVQQDRKKHVRFQVHFSWTRVHVHRQFHADFLWSRWTTFWSSMWLASLWAPRGPTQAPETQLPP